MSKRAAIGIVVAVLLLGVSAFAQNLSLNLPNKHGHPNLESRLDQLVEAYQVGGISEAESFAYQSAIELINALVRVEIEANNKAQIANIVETIKDLGGKFETSYEHLIQALVPIAALESLASLPEIRFIWLPMPLVTEQGSVISEGVGVIGADNWQKAGITGKGVKVAVLDLGFRRFQDLVNRGELPEGVVTRSFRADGDIECRTCDRVVQVHGNAVAEVIHDIAPDAQLFFANFDTIVGWFQALDWAISQNVNVINTSLSTVPECYQEGDSFRWGPMAKKVREAGILWASSAGNSAEEHWAGEFKDGDGNGWHNFLGDDESNTLELRAEEILSVDLIWDDPCERSSNDYDLFLLDDAGKIVARSEDEQNGNDQPNERLTFRVPRSGLYHIKLKRAQAKRNVTFDLFVRSTREAVLEYQEPAGSIREPALAANVVAVGATFWQNDRLEPFSSQGPTRDGRIKPDLVAPDGVANFTFRDFFGTSASSPHVVGAAALVKQVFPAFTPDQIQQFLEQSAEDLGSPGKDKQFGAGRLNLGPVPAQQPVLNVSPTSLSFSGQVGGPNPFPRTVTINNAGGGTLNWTATVNVPWLSISPVSGSAPPPSSVTVSVNIAGLPTGQHQGQITISAPGATNSPVTVPVTLTITSAQPPAALFALKFIKLEFVTSAAWERTLRERCVVYKNISASSSKLKATLPDKSVLEFEIEPAKEVFVCGDVAHIEARGVAGQSESSQGPTLIPPQMAAEDMPPALRFIKLAFAESQPWERMLTGGCVVYKNVAGGEARLTLRGNITLEFEIPAGKRVLVCGDVALINT